MTIEITQTDPITVITLTPEELESGKISSYNLEAALVGFERDGIFVIENAVSTEHLDSLNDRMVPEAKKLYAKKETHRNFGEHTGNIQQEPVPFPEYVHEDIVANKFVSAVTECILGPDPVVRFYSANTAFKASARQPVHVDGDFPFNDHCFALCININLVSTSVENGATELWPGSHRLAKYVQDEVSDELIDKFRETGAPIQPSLPKGSVIVRDFRLWHAGMPNLTDDPRIMLVTLQFPHWYRSTQKVRLPESTRQKIEGFNPRVKFDVEYFPDDTDYLKGSHDHRFDQTY